MSMLVSFCFSDLCGADAAAIPTGHPVMRHFHDLTIARFTVSGESNPVSFARSRRREDLFQRTTL
jgi:hypothetical protein